MFRNNPPVQSGDNPDDFGQKFLKNEFKKLLLLLPVAGSLVGILTLFQPFYAIKATIKGKPFYPVYDAFGSLVTIRGEAADLASGWEKDSGNVPGTFLFIGLALLGLINLLTYLALVRKTRISSSYLQIIYWISGFNFFLIVTTWIYNITQKEMESLDFVFGDGLVQGSEILTWILWIIIIPASFAPVLAVSSLARVKNKKSPSRR